MFASSGKWRPAVKLPSKIKLFQSPPGTEPPLEAFRIQESIGLAHPRTEDWNNVDPR
jgi:hypothetical protein